MATWYTYWNKTTSKLKYRRQVQEAALLGAYYELAKLDTDVIFSDDDAFAKYILNGGQTDYIIDPEFTAGDFVSDTFFNVDTSGGATTQTLPLLATVSIGFTRVYRKKTTDTNALTLQTAQGSEFINGAASFTITDSRQSVTVVKLDATNWNIVGSFNSDKVKNNYIATVDPTPSNDNTENYSVGSNWINVTDNRIFEATDVSTGAAVWERTNSSGGAGYPLPLEYKGNTSTQTAPPATGRWILNNATQNSSTALYLHKTTDAGLNTGESLFELIESGFKVTIVAENDLTQYKKFSVGVPIDQTTYVEYPLTFEDDDGGAFTNNQKTKIFFQSVGGGGGGSGDVVGPASSVDNALARYHLATGKIIQNSTAILDDLGNLTGLHGTGINHTAIANDDIASEIIVDAAGFAGIKAVHIIYITGALAVSEEEEVSLISIDKSASTGGRIVGYEVISTSEGSAEVDALEVGAGVHPVKQISGTFGNLDTILDIAADVLTALSQGGAGNIAVFENDNETMTFGLASKFEQLEFIIGTMASGSGIAPTFEFSTGVGTWAAFSPTDGTNGMRTNGVITWLATDIPSWAVGTGSEFLIRITRTRNTLGTTPILDLVQAETGVVYDWNKDGDLSIRSMRFADRSAPANPGAGLSELYKKTGNDGLFYKPDAAGAEVDLTNNTVPHASDHTNGTDDIQNATNAQKGLATAAQVTAQEANTAASHGVNAPNTSHYLKSETDALIDATLKPPEAYDPTVSGNYPTTYGGLGIQEGDSFRITASQIDIGDAGRSVNIEDLLIAITDSPSATLATDWMVAESNRDQATETVKGVAELATQAETDTGTDDLTIVTPLKLETNPSIVHLAKTQTLTNKTTTNKNETHQVLTDQATITMDCDNGLYATVTIAGARTLANLVNMKTGSTALIKVVTDATPGRTLAYGNLFRAIGNGVLPTIPTAANSTHLLRVDKFGTTDLYVQSAYTFA